MFSDGMTEEIINALVRVNGLRPRSGTHGGWGSHTNLASVHPDLEQYAEAETEARLALEVLEEAVGPEHPRTVGTLIGPGESLLGQRRHEEAETVFRRALDVAERALAPGHLRIGASLQGLARVPAALGRHDEALDQYERALAIFDVLEPDDPDRGAALTTYAGFLRSIGRTAEAEEVEGPNHCWRVLESTAPCEPQR